jgi:hypothetical protein
MPTWILIVIIISAVALLIGCAFLLAYILNLVVSIEKEIREIKAKLENEKK